MNRLCAFFFGFSVLAASTLAAGAGEPPKAVVELFTSQGCSSCPPADAKLTAISRRPDVIALTMPVDYWDYLGWRDTLAKPAFTARQRAYADERGDRKVYTPQMVVNGAVACIGSNESQVDQVLARAADGERLPVPVEVHRSGRSLTIDVGAGSGGPAEVWLLPVRRQETVAIGRGENQGRKATYSNVVQGLEKLGTWTGAQGRFTAQGQADADGYVVLLQTRKGDRPSTILGAQKSAGL